MKFYPMFPVKYIGITEYYSNTHKAIDLAGIVTYENEKKSNIYSYIVCDNAKILKNEYASDYGYFIEYETTAPNGDKYIFASGHFKEKSDLVIGQTYSRGTIAGEIGITGTSTGVHDHFRISINDVKVNPLYQLYVYTDFNYIGDKEEADLMIYDNSEKIYIDRNDIEFIKNCFKNIKENVEYIEKTLDKF